MHQFAGRTGLLAQEYAGITAAFEAFAVSLNEGRYYEAHEDLEAIWYPRRFEQSDEVRLWKGFINAAVSFELIKRGRSYPSLRAWNTYCKYRSLLGSLVSPYKELYVTIARLIENHDFRLRGNGEYSNHQEETDVRIFRGDGVSPRVQAV